MAWLARGDRICRGCWDQMSVPIPIRGPLAAPFRLLGISQSKMNPNICTICERAFRRVKKRQHISGTVTILFADMRGFTELSGRVDAGRLGDIVGAFQDECAAAIWAEDGIVNKQMGDGLMAIFNFPIKRERHAAAAVAAALDLQRRCAALAAAAAAPERIGVGVGIHSGEVEIGEFSRNRSDFTAIGGVVNLAARLESAAAAGEVLVSGETVRAVPEHLAGAHERMLALKGVEGTVQAFALAGGG